MANKPGRPPKYERNERDAAIVEVLAGLGYGVEDILKALSADISRRTLERHYKGEIKSARVRTVGSIGRMLQVEAVQKKNVKAAHTWLAWFGDKPIRDREVKDESKMTLADLMSELDDG